QGLQAGEVAHPPAPRALVAIVGHQSVDAAAAPQLPRCEERIVQALRAEFGIERTFKIGRTRHAPVDDAVLHELALVVQAPVVVQGIAVVQSAEMLLARFPGLVPRGIRHMLAEGIGTALAGAPSAKEIPPPGKQQVALAEPLSCGY